jgi:hypothetical protein
VRKIGIAILAGVAALAAAGTAVAASERQHVLHLTLPDGSVEHIRYSGDVPPPVVFLPTHNAPVASVDPFDVAPFAMFDRMAAEMERQADTMLRQAAMMASQPAVADGKMGYATFANLPAGTVHYSFVSTSSANGVTCTRSTQIVSQGPKLQPKMISQTSGDCGVPPAHAIPAVDGAAAARQPKAMMVKLDPAKDHPARAPAAKGPTV